MFTGIVQGMGTVKHLEKKPGLSTFTITFPVGMTEGLQIGASVAVNGCCLTAVTIDGDDVAFDAMTETLEKTNLGDLKEGSQANVERSARMGDEIGGHVMSGHVLGTAEIVRIEEPENNKIVTLRVPKEWMRYILQKGFIGLDGCSLTVVDPKKEEGTFDVHLIPETLRLTVFGARAVGDRVNVELDSRTQTIVDTVEEVLKQQSRS